MIKLTETYCFDSDGTQFILMETGYRDKMEFKTKKATGEKVNYTNTIGYYSDITKMLEGCIRYDTHKKIKNGDIDNLHELLTSMKELSLQLETTVRGVGNEERMECKG